MKSNESSEKYTCIACNNSYASWRALSVHLAKLPQCRERCNTRTIKNGSYLKFQKLFLKYVHVHNVPPIASAVDAMNNENNENNNGNEKLNDHLEDTTNGIEDIDDDVFNTESGNLVDNEWICYQSKLIHEINLLKILNDISAPLYAYSTLMQWAYNAKVSQYNYDTKNITYHQVVQHLEKSLDMESHWPTPLTEQLKGDNKEMEVVVFKVIPRLLSLFNDTEISKYENLVVNTNDRFGKYQESDY